MADYFSIKLGKKVDYSDIYRIMKDQAKIQQAAAHKNFTKKSKRLKPKKK